MKITDNNIKDIQKDIAIIEKIEHTQNSGFGNPNYRIDVLIEDSILTLYTIDDYSMNYRITQQMLGKSLPIEYIEYKHKNYITKITF